MTSLVINPASGGITLYLNMGVPGSVTLDGVQELSNKKLVAPKVDFVTDANGNEALVITGVASAVNDVEVVNAITGAGPTLRAHGDDANIDLNLSGKGTGKVKVSGAEVVTQGGALGTPASGSLQNCTADGTNKLGYLNVPQGSKSVNYTLVLGDAGKHLLHPSADTTARTFTIPANASVAFPVGTAVTFVNQNGAGALTIAITTDVMRLAGAGTTGSRTLAANGVATALKITATEWIISGVGLT